MICAMQIDSVVS